MTRARRATGSDTDDIVRLAEGMFGEINNRAPGERWRRVAAEAVRRRVDDDLVVFVVDEPDRPGRLMALAAGLVADRLPTSRNPSGRVGYVQWVATDPGRRRRGLARDVTSALLAWFDAADIVVNELHTSPGARALYTSLGFTDAPHPSMRRHRQG